jgi:putative PIN family toxin of toxin-antitoxin system
MRAVLDTNVLVRATKSGTGPAREVLLSFQSPNHVLLLSPWMLEELRRVLTYPRVVAQHRLTPEDVGDFLAGLAQVAEMVQLPEAGAEVSMTTDPQDAPVLQTAILGEAQVLCTLDRHFYDPAVLAYCGQHGLEVLGDAELLARLRAGRESQQE